jgi:hypothetical protein
MCLSIIIHKHNILMQKYNYDTKVNVDQHHEIVSKNLPSHNHETNALREKVCFRNFVFGFNKILFLYKINTLATMGGPRAIPVAP